MGEKNLGGKYKSEALEEILGKEFKVLDYGFIRVVDYMGNDNSIVDAARVSYGRGNKSVKDDESLIRYLMKHKHTTPFEMCEIKLHVKLPIFVARQWMRHRTASINEYSARYSILDNEYYLPEEENMLPQSNINKQGRGDFLENWEKQNGIALIKESSEKSFENYFAMLNLKENPNKKGISREIARITLPVNVYTQFYWKIDLHNFMHFIKLRVDKHAQLEIRKYAEILLEILKIWVPICYSAFIDYNLFSYSISKNGILLLVDILANNKKNLADYCLSKREIQEIEEIFKIKITE